MITAWSVLGGLFAIALVWLWCSHLSLAQSNWDSILRQALYTPIALLPCEIIFRRLAGATNRVGTFLRDVTRRLELFAVTTLLFGVLATVVITYCHLATAAAFPFQDGQLARIDRSLGFDWVAFVELVNSSSLASRVLVEAYQNTPYILIGTTLWLWIPGNGPRLAEFLALMCLTFVGIAIGMLTFPAEGAYAYYHPTLSSYQNIGADSGMWHHQLLLAIRNGATRVIDFNTPNSNCLITFPSGHTVLAIIMTYALRDSLKTLIPALLFNLTMIISTIPRGGHHMIDLIAAVVITGRAIAFVRLPVALRRAEPSSTAVVIAEGGMASLRR
jgi:membrane-associated phospholipid phosphatase